MGKLKPVFIPLYSLFCAESPVFLPFLVPSP
jgi:hypothetical protein